ncbi:MAG: hypothetical protein J0M07_24550 [Anaerolineae bacterium]|nr:hypothetical protein [Anaerolineae bacterium]
MTDANWLATDLEWEPAVEAAGAEPRSLRDPMLPVTFYAALVPLDADEQYVPNQLDVDGTVHFFAAVDMSNEPDGEDLAYELRYFRVAATADGRLMHDAYPVMPLASRGAYPFPREALETLLMDGTLDTAQELAYHTAQAYGLAFPEPEALPALQAERADPCNVSDTPPGLITLDPEREPALEPAAVAGFEAHFADSAYHLLQPIDPVVNYSFEVLPADPWTLELTADKWWLEADGQMGHAGQTLKTYSLESYEWEREIEREVAALDRENLHRTYQEEGLEVAMQRAEEIAVANGELNADRADGRLFTDGPPDRFTTAREAELAGLEDSQVGEPIRDITHDETAEMPGVRVPNADTPEPGSWDELVTQQRDRVEPEVEPHYWQMHYRPVETPEGEPLGTALFVTEFPQLPPNFDDYIEANGMDDSIYPTEARTLEMAHFANEDDARKFEAEFHSYLVPELLDGPELAPEVAKLEGLSGEWEEMDYRGIVDYMSGDRTIVRDESEWRLHDPNAEREIAEQSENSSPEIGL